MAKELPYFQFEPAEYLTKDISFCTLSAQGLFINLCAYYWQRECRITKEQFLRRINNPKEFQELVDEGVIDLDENDIIIKFLDQQYLNATKQSKTNSINGSKGGRPKKENPNESEIKATLKPNESQTKGIREEKRREDKIKVKDIKERKAEFKNSLHQFLEEFGSKILNEFYNYWTEHGENDRKMRFEKEKSFNKKLRLDKWLKNSIEWEKEKTSAKKEKPIMLSDKMKQDYGIN